MKNEIEEKKKLIKDIREDLENIEYWRNNYVFEEELTFEQVKELQNKISNLWMLYYSLYKVKNI